MNLSTNEIKPFAVTHKMVIGLALPMTLAYMTTPLLGLVDTAVVGRMGDAALIGGLATGAVIIDLVFTTFNFLRAGTTGLTAQAFGAEDRVEEQAIFARAMLIAFACGIGFALASPLILMLGLYFMAPGEEVRAAASTYFLIRMLGAPFTLGNYVILGWYIGLGRTSSGLAMQLVINGTNMALSIVLGFHFGMGISGVAIATVIGEIIGFVAGIFWAYHLSDKNARPSWAQILQKKAFIRLMGLNGDIMLRSFVLIFTFAFFTATGSQFGTVVLAANAVLMNFFLFGGYFLDGLATAAEQIVGRAIGAGYREGFIAGLRLTLLWNVLIAGTISVIFWFWGGLLINLITTIADVQQEAAYYLPWAALTPLTGVLAFQMDGVFIGATWTRDMSRMMLLSFIVYIAVWWVFVPVLHNHGLWLALHVFLITRGFALLAWVPLRMRKTFSLQAPTKN